MDGFDSSISSITRASARPGGAGTDRGRAPQAAATAGPYEQRAAPSNVLLHPTAHAYPWHRAGLALGLSAVLVALGADVAFALGGAGPERLGPIVLALAATFAGLAALTSNLSARHRAARTLWNICAAIAVLCALGHTTHQDVSSSYPALTGIWYWALAMALAACVPVGRARLHWGRKTVRDVAVALAAAAVLVVSLGLMFRVGDSLGLLIGPSLALAAAARACAATAWLRGGMRS